jgi:transcriptional regulator with XRE-family HTH domain
MTYLVRVAKRVRGAAGRTGVGAAAVAESRALLAAALRRRRAVREVTQVRLAAVLGSSQSRVAKMEKADPTVSLELLVRGLVALGTTRKEVGRIVEGARRAGAADHTKRS